MDADCYVQINAPARALGLDLLAARRAPVVCGFEALGYVQCGAAVDIVVAVQAGALVLAGSAGDDIVEIGLDKAPTMLPVISGAA